MEPDASDPRDAESDFEQRRVQALLLARMFGDDQPGAKIGRFTVLDRVGRGGMGDVYAAYDPQLDRKVALKILHRIGSDPRVLREARAMASINHPNVAQIYEVGVTNERVFIAMEFVQGNTLRGWLGARERSWRDVLTMYLQAGSGLVAAHGAGIVHRDFKPENVLVGDDGRVRVVDFGLARETIAAQTDDGEGAANLLASHRAADAALTGPLAGTPAYMAPERFRRRGVDTRSDQFAFCVALHEALYGERPYLGDTTDALFVAVERGELHIGRSTATLPDWVVRPVRRGLDPDPEERHPSMQALLDELAKDPSTRRRRWMLAGAGVVAAALTLGTVEGSARYERARKSATCEEAGATIDDVWNADARARVRDGLLATGVSYAPTTAEKVMPWLDDQALAWRVHRTQACMNAEVDGAWDADTLDRAVWCLDERRLELASLVTELGDADGQVVRRAVGAVAGLGKISPCLDPPLLANLPPPPDEDARLAIGEVRVELARAGTLKASGKYGEALDVARAAHEQANSLGWPPLSAAAHQLVSNLVGRTGSETDAEVAAVSAYVDAATAGAWDVAAAAATQLIYTVGVRDHRHAEGRSWATHAAVACSHAGDPLGLREAARLANLAAVHREAGDYPQALALTERALALEEKALGPDHPRLAGILTNLANVHNATADQPRARALYERALALNEEALGRDHPDVADTLSNLAVLDYQGGDYPRAAAHHERALAIREEALGREHRDVATSLSNLAIVCVATGDLRRAQLLHERALAIRELTLGPEHTEVAVSLHGLAIIHGRNGDDSQALALAERALAIWEKALGPEHPDVANGLDSLATLHAENGDYQGARALFERALPIREKTLGPEHPRIAASLTNLAGVHLVTGNYAEARALFERALAMLEKALGPEHVDLSYPLVGLTEVALGQSRPVDAIPLAERAMRVRLQAGVSAVLLADTQLNLARALWDAPIARGRDRARAAELAAAARGAYRAAQGEEKRLAEVEAWLRRADSGGENAEATRRPISERR